MNRLRIALAAALVLPLTLQTGGRSAHASSFLDQASSLKSKLAEWRQELTKTKFNLLPASKRQRKLLERERSACLAWMGTLDRDIEAIQGKPTTAGEARLALDAEQFAGTVHALDDLLTAVVSLAPTYANQAALHAALQQENEIGSIKGIHFDDAGLTHQLDAIALKLTAPEAQKLGEISGHVYRADNGRPLPDATIKLGLESFPDVTAISTRTAADGSYSVSDVPPGTYWLVAYRKGFHRETYRGNSPRGYMAVLDLHAGQTLSGIDVKLHQLVSVTQMNDQALVAEFGIERFWLQIRLGQFSPDGKLFAFAVGDPLPQQVWLYEMGSGRLMHVTKAPSEGWSTIRAIAWVGETMYADAYYPNAHHYFAATAEGVRKIPLLPPEARAALRQESTPYIYTARNSRFAVRLKNPCGGSACGFRLTVTTTRGRQIYQSGDLGHENFIFDRRRSIVLFPKFFQAEITLLDLNTRRVRHFYLPIRAEWLLDAKPEAGGFLVAYTSYGPCDGYGGRGGLAGIHPQPAPYNVCFADIPFEGKK